MRSIEEILQRNSKVETDKAWETSYTRRGTIALLTYITAVTFLTIIYDSAPFIHALVPVGGYLVSTLSLPFIKVWWIKKHSKNKDDKI